MNRRIALVAALRRPGIAALLGAALSLGGVACGSGSGDAGATEPVTKKPEAAATVGSPATPPAPAPAAATEPPGRTVEGTAIATDPAPAGAPAPLRLAIGDAGRLAGEVAIDGSTCAISGLADESTVRGWLRCEPTGGATTPRRGTLVGEKAGGSYAGTFALSDDGAAKVIKGTWTAGK
jgi:hypothetical protein